MPSPFDEEIANELRTISKGLPTFSDGRINYSNAPRAAVLNCFITFQEKILLLKRSANVAAYHGKWNGVAGYLDEIKPLREKVIEEINEETGITLEKISKIRIGKKIEVYDGQINKTWVIFPALAELNTRPLIKLDFEHTEFVWIKKEELSNYDTVPNLTKSLENALNGE